MKFFQIIPPNTKIDFVGKFKPALFLSAILVGGVLVAWYQKGLNFGVDFTGGTSIQVRFPESQNADRVRALVTEFGAPDATVVAMGTNQKEYMITSRSIQDLKGASPLQAKLEERFGKNVILQSDVVGPRVGAELKRSAVLSLFYSIVLIMIYIWFRFDFRFAPGATIALIHDLIMAVGFYVLTGREFNITAVAALLTIAGYGVNDTIVIYDHVRDLFKHKGDQLALPALINEAVNMTLSRTVVTALLVFLSLIPIAIACEGELEDFALALMVGVVVGSYTTFFIAAPLTLVVEKIMAKKTKTSVRPAAGPS